MLIMHSSYAQIANALLNFGNNCRFQHFYDFFGMYDQKYDLLNRFHCNRLNEEDSQ